MSRFRSRQGFSLIELLTVIAIIAILAAIIFPVMNSVKQRANQTKCMSNLMNIDKAIKMYKLDNRKYPDRLCPLFVNGTPFDRWASSPTDGAIMGEYIKSAEAFRCPTSKNTDFNQGVTVNDPWGSPIQAGQYYAVDDYDMLSLSGQPGRIRYTTSWATKAAQGGTIQFPDNDAGTGPCVADPIFTDPNVDQLDYARQLQFRDPPEDTVVTWCTNHSATGTRDVVLFLSGTVKAIDGKTVANCKWRTRPPRS